MEAQEVEFIVVQKAKSAKGGDKYVCVSNPDFNIYMPQVISRDSNNDTHQKLGVTVRVIKPQ
jgi:hypothetical protein